MKKLLWIFGGFLVVLLVAIIAIPFFVSVDQYRPQIQAEANKRLNGKLELGKLSLSLWGKIKVHADSIRVTVNGFPQPLLDTKQFHMEVPIWSLISGSPQVVAVLDDPKIDVVKELDGRTNVLELMKPTVPPGCATALAPAPAAPAAPAAPVIADEVKTAAAAPEKKPVLQKTLPKDVKVPPKAQVAKPAAPVAPAAPAAPPAPVATATPPCPPADASTEAGAPGEPGKVPSLLAGARLGVRINEGDVRYFDKVAKSEYRVEGLDLDAKNLGLGSTMDLRVKAPLKGRTPSLVFDGPVELAAEITPVLVGTSVRSAKGTIEVNASDLNLEVPGKFKKAPNTALTLKTRLAGNEKETLIELFEARFADFRVMGKGRATVQPVAGELLLTTDPIKLEKLAELVPMLKEYDLKGSATARVEATLTEAAMKANGDFKISEGSLYPKAYLKAPFQFQLQAGFTESSLNIGKATLTGPETDFSLTGSVKNILAPQFALALKGKSFNVDKSIVLPGSGGADGKPGAPGESAPAPAPSAAPKPDDKNPMAELAKNPILAKAVGTLTADIGKVLVYGTALDQVTLRSQLSDMELKASEASFKTFGGQVKANGNFDLKSAPLSYSTQGAVSGISGKEAFRTYFPKFQNTVEGTINAKWNVSGGLYPSTTRIRSMRGTANLVAENGVIKSVDVQSTINSTMQKIPFLKDKKPLEVDDGFKTLTADIRFTGEGILIDPIDMQPRNRGFVLKGKSTISENLEQETLLDVYDPQGRLPRDIQRPGKPALAIRLTGPISAPKTDYEYTLKKVAASGAQNALKNVAGKALDKFLGGERKEGEKGDPLKDAAQKLKEKFKLKF